MKDTMKSTLYLLFFTSFLLSDGVKLTFTNAQETIFSKNSSTMRITSATKIENFSKDIAKGLFKRKAYFEDNFYYLNGAIETKRYHANFKKMYIYAKVIYITDGEVFIDEYVLMSEKIMIHKDKIIFGRLKYHSHAHRGSKIKYIYYLNKKNRL